MRRPLPPRRPARKLLARLALLAAVGLFSAGTLAAYTVHLKDGSAIITKKKYIVQGDKAILQLPSGTETVLSLAEIDLVKTEAANRTDLGNAIVIENGRATGLEKNSAAPPGKTTLKELLEQRAAAQGRDNAGAVALDATPGSRAAERELRNNAGQAPLRNEPLSTEIRTFIFGRGIQSLEVQQGATAARPRLVFQTTSETQVFRALQASAGALIAVREKFPRQIEEFEVICDGPAGGRGGHFHLTPTQAADIISNRVDLPTYFVQNVEF